MPGVIAQIPKLRFLNSSGSPLAGGTLTVYEAGTSTKAMTFQDRALTIENTNPITLDGVGACVVWLDSTKSYKLELSDRAGVVQWTQDDIVGGGVDTSVELAAPAIQAATDAASASATAAEASRDAIDNRIYPGSYAADPTTRPDGSASQDGDECFNSTEGLRKRFNGATWQASDISTANLAAPTGSSLVGFIQSGTGSVARTAQDKDRDFISVLDYVQRAAVDGIASNQAGIEAAVAYAYANGLDLYWPHPGSEYVSTGSIPNFHSVRHFGPGAIKRGTDTFYVEPKEGQENRLYVSTTGSAANDGLSSGQAMTLQAALDALEGYGPVLNGKWDVALAAGTYTSGEHTIPRGLRAQYPILIYGPAVGGHPNVPTAILDGAGHSSAFGIQASRGTPFYVQDVKFINYGVNGVNDSGGGIAATDGCFLATKNVHTDNCYDGILCYHGRLYVGGGVYKLSAESGTQPANYSAIKSMFNTTHSIGYDYNRDTGAAPANGAGNGPQMSPNTVRVGRGVIIQENSTGHVEGLTIDQLSRGIEVVASSRAHVADCDFKRCGSALEVESGCNVFDGGGNAFHAATVDENDNSYNLIAGAVETSAYAGAIGTYIVNQVFAPDNPANTGSVADVTMHTIAAFFDGHEMQRRGIIRVRVFGTLTGTAGTKTVKLRVGGHLGPLCTFPPAVAGTYMAELTLTGSGNDTQVGYSFGLTNGISATSAGIGETYFAALAIDIDDGTAQDLAVQTILGDAADTITVSYIEVHRGGT